MRMVDDAASSRGTGDRGSRLSPVDSSRSALVAAGVSRQALRPLSCLAKHFALGSLFRFDRRHDRLFECRFTYACSSVWASGFAGHAVLVDRSVAQSMAGRALRVTAVWRTGGADEVAGGR